jgi:putative ABC transport system permease protein
VIRRRRAALVVIDETTARELWGDADPLGRRIVMEWGDMRDAEVVGVVRATRLRNLETAPRATLYWPEAQMPSNFMTVLLRARGDGDALAAALRSPSPSSTRRCRWPTSSGCATSSPAAPRARASPPRLLATFAILATALAAIGLYGLLAGAVTARRRELGVRMALGADARRLLTGVVARGLRLVALGIGVGLPARPRGRQTGRLAALRDFAARSGDAAGRSAVLLTVGWLAALLPARRAARTDPAGVLREG